MPPERCEVCWRQRPETSKQAILKGWSLELPADVWCCPGCRHPRQWWVIEFTDDNGR